MNTQSPNDFPCALLVTDFESASIDFCNDYGLRLLEREDDNGTGLHFADIVSRASLIFFESFIRPTVLKSNQSIEIQITLVTKSSKKLPCVCNVELKSGKLHWSIFTAVQRDKLYQELIDARDTLEQKTIELTHLTRVDPLTGLLNRRAASEDISALLNRVKRQYTPLAFLLIDVDYFKRINDEHGHDKGDEVLVSLSKSLMDSCRETDILARWGGEEFLIILFNSSLRNTEKFCQRLHTKIASLNFEGIELSLSIGASQLKKASLKQKNISDMLIKEADIALFEAKEKGRSRTEFCGGC